MKSRILKFILGLIFGFLVGFLGYYMLPQYWPKPKEGLGISNVREIHASYPTDYENDTIPPLLNLKSRLFRI